MMRLKSLPHPSSSHHFVEYKCLSELTFILNIILLFLGALGNNVELQEDPGLAPEQRDVSRP